MEANLLETIDARQLGQELKRAREQRGLKQAEAAEVIQVARTTITAIEQGQRRIKIDELMALARAYGRQVSDFLRPRPVLAPFQVQYRGPVKRAAADQQSIDQAQAELERLCRNYLELEALTGLPLARNEPPVYPITGLKAARAAEDIAAQERNRLGLGDGPLPMLRPLLEQEVGLRIFYLPLRPSTFSEIYAYDPQAGGCLAINILHPEERRRWSLAHGYAHFLVQRYQPAAYIEGAYKHEQFADYFAMNFLLPAGSLIRQYNKLSQAKAGLTPAGLCILANYFAVSVAALTRRLEDMGLAPRGTWERLKKSGFRIREAQRQLGLPDIPAQTQKLPARYQYLAVEAYKEGLISEGLFARFLQLDRLEARQMAQVLQGHEADVTEDRLIDLDFEQSVAG